MKENTDHSEKTLFAFGRNLVSTLAHFRQPRGWQVYYTKGSQYINNFCKRVIQLTQ